MDFLEQKSRIPTQKELDTFYAIKPHNLEYFRKTRGGHRNMVELFEECVGPEVLAKYQIPFEKILRPILLKHMEEFGKIPERKRPGEVYH